MQLCFWKRRSALALLISGLGCLVFSTSARANLLSNAGFETGASIGAGDTLSIPGWGSFDNAYLTSSPNPTPPGPHSGIGALKLFSIGVAGVFQTFSANPGEVYNFNGFGLATSVDPIGGGNFAAMKIVWFGAGGAIQPLASDPNLLGTDETDDNPGILASEITSGTTQDSWLPYVAQGTAPAGTQSVQVLALFVSVGGLNGNNQTGAAWYDDLSLTQVAVPEPASITLLVLASVPVLARRRRSALDLSP